MAMQSHHVPSSLSSFTSVVVVVTFKLSTHTKFWSVILILSILLFSLGLYVAYMWVSNYYLSDYVKGTTIVFFRNG
jgi:phospholipid-transporting ATPase